MYSIHIMFMHKYGGKKINIKHSNKIFWVTRLVVVVFALAIGGLGVFQSSHAEAVQTATNYCAKYSSSSEKDACASGIRDETTCGSYSDIFGQNVADICFKAAQDKKAGLISDPKSSGSNSGANSSNSSGDGLFGTSAKTSKENQAYAGNLTLACSQYANDENTLKACAYGGGIVEGGDNSKPYKPATDCLTNKNYSSGTLLRSACLAGSNAGSSYNTSLGGGGINNNSGTNGLLDSLTGMLGGAGLGGLGSTGSTGSGTTMPGLTSTGAGQGLGNMTQAQALTGMIDMLHMGGPNANVDTKSKSDNNKGYYINGAGKKQPIHDLNEGHPPKAPAILFFNGGAWHANDQTGQHVATGSPCKNQTDGDSCKNYGGPPAGGGANARGFATYDVTYRLGSSGVYYMLEDVLRGIRHMKQNANLYDIDPEKIVIWGDSAGGSLSMRAAATGASGAKVAVGWSAPTNAYSVLFASYKSFMIGLDHSTCIPTDLAGLANITDLFVGGSGQVAQYGQGALTSNDFSQLGSLTGGGGGGMDPTQIIGELLTAGQYASISAMNGAAISQQVMTAYNNGNMTGDSLMASGLGGSMMNIASKKFVECLDNFKALSPAMYASPNTPPSFLAGFDTDDLVPPQQAYDMRDKLQSLGIRSDAMILQGDADAAYPAFGASDNHLGYDSRFVCATLNFVWSVIEPGDAKQVDCKTGASKQNATNTPNVASGNSSNSKGSGSGNNSGQSSNSNKGVTDASQCQGPIAQGSEWTVVGGKCQSQSKPGNCQNGTGTWTNGSNGCSQNLKVYCDTQQGNYEDIENGKKIWKVTNGNCSQITNPGSMTAG